MKNRKKLIGKKFLDVAENVEKKQIAIEIAADAKKIPPPNFAKKDLICSLE